MFCVLLLSWSVVHNHYGSSPQALSACLQWLSLVPESSGNSVVKNGNVMTAFESKLIGIAHGGDARARASARAQKPNWWTIDEPYKNAILFRLANQLKDGRNEKPLQVQYKYIWYEATANEYAEDFIIDFGASTHWDLQTLWVRNARVNYKTLKNTTRYQ